MGLIGGLRGPGLRNWCVDFWEGSFLVKGLSELREGEILEILGICRKLREREEGEESDHLVQKEVKG